MVGGINMERDGMEILQVLLKDFALKEAIDPKFFGNLQKEFDNVKIVSIIVAVGDDEEPGAISLLHPTPEDVKQKRIIIDTKNTEHLDKVISVIKKQDGA